MKRTDAEIEDAIAIANGAADTMIAMFRSDFYRPPQWHGHLAAAILGSLERTMRLYAILRDDDTTTKQLYRIHAACPSLFDKPAPHKRQE